MSAIEKRRLVAEAENPDTVAICAACGRGFLSFREGLTDPYAPKDKWAAGEFRSMDPREWPVCGGAIIRLEIGGDGENEATTSPTGIDEAPQG